MVVKHVQSLRKTRNNLRRAIRKVTLTRSPNGKESAQVHPTHKVLVGTHHRTGTAWMRRIFRKICWDFGLEFFSGRQDDLPVDFDVFLQNHSQFDLTRMRPDYRGIHLIRDPRDVIVSGCFYHQRAAEKWLHVRREEYSGLTYQEKLNTYPSLDDKLMFEMEHHSITILDMLAWSYSNPNFLEIRYEDLIADDRLMHFHEIFNFLGFPGRTIPSILSIAYENSLFSGKVKISVHTHSGESGQWRKYFKPAHSDRFLELFGNALVRLGYEKDDEWARN